MGEKLQRVFELAEYYEIKCEMCNHHLIPKVGQPGATWQFNGDLFLPSFTPSINELQNPPDRPSYRPGVPTRRCHFTITNGEIKYHNDCTHKLAGKTMKLAFYSAVEVRSRAAA